jgi:hypothetical protein
VTAAGAFRHYLATAQLCRYGTLGPATAPVASVQELPANSATIKSRMGVYINPLGGPDLTQWERVQLQVIVRIDAGNPTDSTQRGWEHAEKVRNALHGMGDGMPFSIGPDDAPQWVSNVLARDTAPVNLGPETGSSVPRWSVVFTADVHNPSARRQEITQ